MSDMNQIKMKVMAGDVHAFYVTTEWKKKRKQILERDNNLCQRCLCKFDGGHPNKKMNLTKAKYVHHIIPMKEDFAKALDDDNLVSLCFRCHEIVEGREERFFSATKKRLTEERW